MVDDHERASDAFYAATETRQLFTQPGTLSGRTTTDNLASLGLMARASLSNLSMLTTSANTGGLKPKDVLVFPPSPDMRRAFKEAKGAKETFIKLPDGTRVCIKGDLAAVIPQSFSEPWVKEFLEAEAA